MDAVAVPRLNVDLLPARGVRALSKTAHPPRGGVAQPGASRRSPSLRRSRRHDALRAANEPPHRTARARRARRGGRRAGPAAAGRRDGQVRAPRAVAEDQLPRAAGPRVGGVAPQLPRARGQAPLPRAQGHLHRQRSQGRSRSPRPLPLRLAAASRPPRSLHARRDGARRPRPRGPRQDTRGDLRLRFATHVGTGTLRRGRRDLGIPARPRAQRHRADDRPPARGRRHLRAGGLHLGLGRAAAGSVELEPTTTRSWASRPSRGCA